MLVNTHVLIQSCLTKSSTFLSMVLYFSIPLCWTMHVEVSKIRGTLSVWFSKRDTHRETQRGREREREGEREGDAGSPNWTSAVYRLHFDTQTYFDAQKQTGFYPYVEVSA